MALSSASPERGKGNILIFHRLTGMHERIGRVEVRVSGLEKAVGALDQTIANLKIAVGKIDTKMNIVLGTLGAIGSGASFLLIRLLAS